MGGVGAAPVIIGGQRQDAEDAADPVVGLAVGEERAVAAIVLDHEQADKKAGGRDDQDQAPPLAIGTRRPKSVPTAPTKGTTVTASSNELLSRLGLR